MNLFSWQDQNLCGLESGVHQRLESCAEWHQNDVILRSDGYLLGSARQCISPGLFRLSWIWKRSSPPPALGRGSRRIGWGGGHGTVWSTAGNFQGLLRPRTRSQSREGWSKNHVWSLTRINFVGLFKSRLSEESVFCFFARFVKAVFFRRTYETRVTHLSISWYLNISRKKHTRRG